MRGRAGRVHRRMAQTMVLKGARIALSAVETAWRDVAVEGGRLTFDAGGHSGPAVDLRDYLILPGLINAHDHLEFNLFPRLGAGPYPNATSWARDIYRPDEPPVNDQLSIPKPVRLIWGGIKNLVSGVTTVLHHNPYHPIFREGFPVRVVERYGWSHSLAFSSDVVADWAATPPGAPFLIHAAEGIDKEAAGEIVRLDAVGVIGPSTVIVHGVALDENGVALLKRRGASLVWCPTSNLFTLGRTLPGHVLESGIRVALGTDSALTGRGDLIDEIAAAVQILPPEQVYAMVTSTAARLLRLDSGEGAIAEGGVADLLIVRDRGRRPAEALAELRPEAVMVNGRMKLISAGLADRFAIEHLRPLEVAGRGRFFVDCDTRALLAASGAAPKLAGRSVAA